MLIKTFALDINECATSPCQNGGSCIDQINAYTCNCVDGYDGLNCENGNKQTTLISFRHHSIYKGFWDNVT